MSAPISEWLREEASSGFPTEYLVARIRARRTMLIADWRGLVAGGPPPGLSDERIWEALLRELEWLYGQMNRGLRSRFAPVFLLFELKTIVLCLRNRSIEHGSEIERLLSRSLLAAPLQSILRRRTDLRTTVIALADAMACAGESFRQLTAAYVEDSLKGFEDSLVRVYLQHVVGEQRDRILKEFFVVFIDLRNIMLLYKSLRWRIEERTQLIAGGTVPLSSLQEILARRNPAELDALVTRVTGLKDLPAVAGEGSLETILLRSLTKRLRTGARGSAEDGLILDYLWRSYVQARNLAVLHHGSELDAGTLENELIL